jgi:hypothetical protein
VTRDGRRISGMSPGGSAPLSSSDARGTLPNTGPGQQPLSSGAVKDVRGPYIRSLEESDRPREHWRGIDPEDGQTQWLFQTVEDEGRRVPIRQIVVHPTGEIDRYWWKHLEDEVGFLTDQPVDYTDQLAPISSDDFLRLWRA